MITFADWFSSPVQLCELPLQQYSEDGKGYESTKEDCSAGKIVALWRSVGRLVDSWHDDLTAAATIVIAVFTTVLGIFTVSLARSTRTAAIAAQDAAEHIPRAERAYLFMVVNGETIRKPLMDAYAGADSTNQDEIIRIPLAIAFSFENQGRTPAIVREISVSLHHWSDLPANPPVYTSELQYLPTNTYVASGKATEQKEITRFAGPVTRQAATSLLRGDSFIWFFGRIIYDDVFGARHEHAFIWRYGIGYFLPYYGNDKYIKNT